MRLYKVFLFLLCGYVWCHEDFILEEPSVQIARFEKIFQIVPSYLRGTRHVCGLMERFEYIANFAKHIIQMYPAEYKNAEERRERINSILQRCQSFDRDKKFSPFIFLQETQKIAFYMDCTCHVFDNDRLFYGLGLDVLAVANASFTVFCCFNQPLQKDIDQLVLVPFFRKKNDREGDTPYLGTFYFFNDTLGTYYADLLKKKKNQAASRTY